MFKLSLKSFALITLYLSSSVSARNVQAPNIALPSTAAGTKQQVQAAFESAYTAYLAHARGQDDLQPESETFGNPRNGWGATVFDALDTMLVMGLDSYYEDAINFVSTVDFSQSKVQNETVSVFETTIRYLGGMLSAYELNGRKDAILLQQAKTLGDKLVHAWTAGHAIPYGQIDFATNTPVNQVSNIAEAGTLTLEFTLLSQLTGDPTYANLAQGAVKAIIQNPAPYPGLPPQGIDPNNGESVGSYLTWGGGSDSYFEYLIKLPRMFNDVDSIYAKTWLTAVETSIAELLELSTVGPFYYIADYDGLKIRHVGSHLACFLAGNWILGGRLLDNEAIVDLALELNEGCWNTYERTSTKIGPEAFAFVSADGDYTGAPTDPSPEDEAFYNENGFYILNGGSDYFLRPEVLESNFYAYRATGNQTYLDRAKQALSAFNKVLSINGAYAGINDVNSLDGEGGGFIDDTPSYFFAETLKYLYLTFDDPNRISLDNYVFNTECHPYPVGPSTLSKRDEPEADGIRSSPTQTTETEELHRRAFVVHSGPVPQISPDPKLPKQLADIFSIWALPFNLLNLIGL